MIITNMHLERLMAIEKAYNKKATKKLYSDLVNLVIHAEKLKILYVKKGKKDSVSSYHKNVRWYLGKLQRNKKIEGFTGVVGRPIGSKKKNYDILESAKRLIK